MRQEDLKNKMDQVGHDFDQESLWANIEVQQQKKKRSVFLWFLPIGGLIILGIGLFYFMSGNTVSLKNETTETIVDSDLNQETQNKMQSINTNELIEKPYINRDAKSAGSTPAFIENKNNSVSDKTNFQTKNSTSKTETNIIDKTQGAINENSIISSETKAASSQIQATNLSKQQTINHFENNSQRQSYYQQKNGQKNRIDDEVMITGVKDIELVEKVLIKKVRTQILVSNVESLFISPFIIPKKELLLNAQTTQNIEDHSSKIIIGLYTGIGFDFHDFQGGDIAEMRSKNENALETVSFGAFGRKALNSKLFAELDLRWSKSQTRLQKSERTNSYAITSSNQLVEEWIELDYTYYNEYYTLDAGLGLGYKFRLSNSWFLAPTLSLGYNLTSYQKGDYWDTKFKLSSLEDAVEYRSSTSIYFGGQLKVMKEFSNNFVLEIDLEIQKRNTLTNTEFYTHNYTPLLFKFSVGKRF